MGTSKITERFFLCLFFCIFCSFSVCCFSIVVVVFIQLDNSWVASQKMPNRDISYPKNICIFSYQPSTSGQQCHLFIYLFILFNHKRMKEWSTRLLHDKCIIYQFGGWELSLLSILHQQINLCNSPKY